MVKFQSSEVRPASAWEHGYVRPAGRARAQLDFHGRKVLSLIIGPASVLPFNVIDVSCHANSSYDNLEIRQLLDLSALSAEAPAFLKVQSPVSVSPISFPRTTGFYPFEEYRFVLIRFGSILLPVGSLLGDLFKINVADFFDARGVPIDSTSFCLIRMRGHGGSGSIQLVTPHLADRLVRAYPTIYSF